MCNSNGIHGEGNLRQWLQNKNNKLSLENKFDKLRDIAWGLSNIHQKRLIHQDLHSGNILNYYRNYKNKEFFPSAVSDLGLSQIANYQKQDGQIFGVLPYVAPEVLRGEPYTQTSDVYSFGIVAYELLANAYPYPEMDDMNLSLKVCHQGLRPDIDKVLIPQLLRDLIKDCWDISSNKRPNSRELWKTILNWKSEVVTKKSTIFYHQYQVIENEYNHFSQNTPYQIHPVAVTTSKMIDTKKIAELVKKMQENEQTLSRLTKIAEQIKEIERKVEKTKNSLDSELVDKFIETKKKLIKDKKNKEIKIEARKLGKQLEEKGLSEEKLEEIIRYCENLVELEQQLEKEQSQSQIEIPPKK